MGLDKSAQEAKPEPAQMSATPCEWAATQVGLTAPYVESPRVSNCIIFGENNDQPKRQCASIRSYQVDIKGVIASRNSPGRKGTEKWLNMDEKRLTCRQPLLGADAFLGFSMSTMKCDTGRDKWCGCLSTYVFTVDRVGW